MSTDASSTDSSSNTPELKGKALLTGASGFIGGRLRDALLERGLDVIAIRRKGSPPSKKGRSVEAEYDDVAGLTRILETEKPDFVLHVAGATKGVTYDDFRKGNVVPTENLLRAVEAGHPDLTRFVLISSQACYGPSTKTRAIVEDDPRRPVEFYGQSKLEAEHAVESRGTKIPWTILRPAGVYGPGDVDFFNLFKEAVARRNVFFGNRDQKWSAIYVDDCVEAILLSMTHPAAIGQGFFVEDGRTQTWVEFQNQIVKESGKKALTLDFPAFVVTLAGIGGELATRIDGKPRLFNRQKAKMGAQEAWIVSADKLRTRLGWSPKVEADEGIRRAFAWYRDQKWL
ncbi:MAG: NAD-dependent epimerase/dehydratase family protein [Deltaproteobacteria bacterium]|nr:NAD-dependent epimerase/dehydratase family protein [Deltaproteobacteria bacterium]